jgi:hypothetical protein
MRKLVDWNQWGRYSGSIVTSYGPIVDYGHEYVPCPWCGTRDCLKKSETGPLPDGRTIFYCQTNRAPAFRSFLG